MRDRHWMRHVLAWCVIAIGVTAQPAPAQEQYELDQGQWRQVDPVDPESPEGRLQAIRKLIAQGDGKTARKLADEWIKANPTSDDLPEAYLLRGDADVARRHEYNALFSYEYVIRYFSASDQFETALDREYEIARLYVNGMKRLFLGMRILTAEGEGEELLIRIQERAPGSEVAEKASMELANYYFRDGDMPQAAEAYDIFLLNYPDSRWREWAMLQLIWANLARFKGPAYDATGLIEAMQRLKQYRQLYPAAAERLGLDSQMVRIDESLARKDVVTAQWYTVRKDYISAAYIYRRVLEDFPRTAAAADSATALATLPVPRFVKTAPLGLTPMQVIRQRDEPLALQEEQAVEDKKEAGVEAIEQPTPEQTEQPIDEAADEMVTESGELEPTEPTPPPDAEPAEQAELIEQQLMEPELDPEPGPDDATEPEIQK